MGQFPSRAKHNAKRSSTPDPTPSPSSTVAAAVPTEADTAQPSARSAQTIRQSRRSTLRRGIADLVPHGFLSKESRENNGLPISDDKLTHPTTRMRKRWRTSKRWSRALCARATEEQCPTSTADSAADTRTGKERENESQLHDIESSSSSSTQVQSQPQTPLPSSPSVLLDSSSHSIPTSDLSESQSPANISSEVGQSFFSSPEQSLEPEPLPTIQTSQDLPVDDSPLGPPTAPSLAEEPLSSAPQRHFPPQGTLVVVQGVVNTTDTGSNSNNANTVSTSNSIQTPPSRPNSSLLPTPPRGSRSPTPTGDRTTNRNSSRLSSIIRRPTSIFSDNRRSSGLLDGDAATDTASSVAEPITDLATSASTDLLPPSDSNSGTTIESNNDTHQQQRPLSPGSIDVLGTLLSVAAAATAASLFSPNSFTSRNNDPSIEQDSNRPTSPTPTAGLGLNGIGPLDTLAGLGFPMERDSQYQQTGVDVGSGSEGQNVSRDRLRGAWDTLRDRLGLHNGARPSGNSTEPQSMDGSRVDGSRGTGNGTGETMISEMARALGTGLGLQEDGGLRHPARQHRAPHEVLGGTPDSSSPGAAAGDAQIPAEGSFERFLFNLQSDLRAVLSGDGSVAESTATDRTVPTEADNNTTGASPLPIHQNVVREQETSFRNDSRNEDQGNEEFIAFEGVGQGTGDSMTVSPGLESPVDTPVTPHHGGRVGGGINLWRSYRFPPIVAPSRPVPIHQSGSTVARTPTPPVPVNSRLPPRSESSNPSEATNSEWPEPILSSPPAMPTPDIPALDIVVPVIIVGLQSVNIDNRGDQHDGHETILTRPDPITDEVEPEGSATEDRPNTPRGRPWHSRAASALRNLRPGRRPGMAVSGANEPNASRTFLIYVIGGYYPPNHHIVTGTDGMDSYEALWELAALLGQVKPPVATPEDIENSGLQIIKPEDIEQYASDGKVASNCIDRCLICLDDYESEDDLRVMSCKHFFHKSCVDKWLQIGRNNCPACRTKGVVTTNNEADPVPPAVSHTPAAV